MVVLMRIWNYLVMEGRSRSGSVDVEKSVIGVMGNPGY